MEDEMKDILDSPCVFCGYNGRGYWQVKTHDVHCPWHNLGGGNERLKAVRDVVSALTPQISFRAGIREVVEWVGEANAVKLTDYDHRSVIILYGDWEANLKEWGVSNG